MASYLIQYKYQSNHLDPDLKEFIYEQSGTRGETLKRTVGKDDYLFFHKDGYITGYIVVKRVISGLEAKASPNINSDAQNDDWVFIGEKEKSERLTRQLPLTRKLLEQLSLSIDFKDLDNKKRTEKSVINSATRAHRKLTNDDISKLLKEVKSSLK